MLTSFANLFYVWLNERELDSPICVYSICCDMFEVEVYEGNLAHTKILSSGAFLKVSRNVEGKTRSMNFSYHVRKTY